MRSNEPATARDASIEIRTQYTCPMHPEILRDAPGGLSHERYGT